MTIMSSLCNDVIILGINFLFSQKKRVLMMVHAKNYETVSTFVKVMQRKLWPLLSRHGVILLCITVYCWQTSTAFKGHYNIIKLSHNVTADAHRDTHAHRHRETDRQRETDEAEFSGERAERTRQSDIER